MRESQLNSADGLQTRIGGIVMKKKVIVQKSSGNIFKDLGLKNPAKLLKAAKKFSKNKHIGSKFSEWLKEEGLL